MDLAKIATGRNMTIKGQPSMRGDVFAKAANSQRPGGAGEVMHHHQEQGADGEAVKEHEGEQPGAAELKKFVLLPTYGQADHG